MQKPVLIVIDMLNSFLRNWQPEAKEKLVVSINELADLMRSYKFPVLWVRQEFEPDLSDALPEMRSKQIYLNIKGSRECQITSELRIGPEEIVIVKKRYSAFFKTGLDDLLERLQPDGIILAGIHTHACIRTTAIDAYQRDFQVILAGDCIDSYDRRHHTVSLEYMRDKIASVLSNSEIRRLLESERSKPNR